MSADLQDLRRKLPRGPETKSALDAIVDQLAAATNSRGLHEKLVRLGWTSLSGQPLPWTHWIRRTAWNG